MQGWYVAKTKARREYATSAMLMQRGVETFLPMLPPSSRARSRGSMGEPLFPGYLLVRLGLESDTWLAARSAPGIAYFLGGGGLGADAGLPTPLPDELVEDIRRRAAGQAAIRQRPTFTPGQPVLIRRGPFSGLEAVFDGSLSASGRVRVLLEIVQRLVPVVLDEDELSAITREAMPTALAS